LIYLEGKTFAPVCTECVQPNSLYVFKITHTHTRARVCTVHNVLM